jgi:hypothetical protein
MQFSDGSEVEVEVLRVQLETFGELKHRLLELHERNPDVLNLFGREGLFLETPDGLALHQLANELDEAEYQLDDRSLHIFGFGIPPQRRGAWAAWGSWGAWGNPLA